MQFDIRTLMVAVALTTAFCAVARFMLWRMHRGVPGLAHWAWASMLGAAALGLVAFRDATPDIAGLTVPQLMIALGFVLVWDGFRRFLGLQPLSRIMLAVLGVGVLGPALLFHLLHSLVLRAQFNSLIIALITAAIAYDLLRTAGPERLAARSMGWVYAANAVFFASRGLITLFEPGLVGAWRAGTMGAFPLLWWLGFTVVVTLGMALMTGERLQADLDRQARRDPLTGALNRRAFAMVAEKVLSQARRDGQPVALLMMDLDHFKRINDTMGHAVGDRFLCLFVSEAQRELRAEDVFCRFGGEEFLALLPRATAQQAWTVAERLRLAYAGRAADEDGMPASSAVPLTVSIGVGEIAAEEDLDHAIRRTDRALYVAKAKGRDRCEMSLALQTAS